MLTLTISQKSKQRWLPENDRFYNILNQDPPCSMAGWPCSAVHHVHHRLHGGCDVMYMCTMIIEHKTSGAHMFELVRTPGEVELRDTSSTTSNVLQGIFKPVCPCVFA